MPKLEAKSGKSTDCAFKLFGRTIPVKSSADCCENSGGFDGENEEKGGLKRPTKVVACPRCESMDTKFCYFNNYNVNQPRHYCRKCQRYWTAGGALRNVPVGAGRRKNKPSFGIHQGHFVEVSENVWTDGQTCIPMRPSLNSDKLVKVESVYPELRIFDEGFNGAEAAYAQGKPKPQSYLDGYSHRLNLPSEKNVKEGFEKPLGVDLCGKELPESYTHAGKRVGSGYMEKPSCSHSDKTQVSATKGESSSEVVQTMDDGVCDSSLNGMVSAGPKSEPQAMRPNDFSSSSFPPYSSMSVIGNSWPVYYNGYFANMPSGISTSGSLTNGVSWFPPSLAHGGNWHVPSGSIWGKQWGLPWKLGNTDSDLKTLGKHERDEATPASKTDRDRSLWMPKTQRINDSGEALNSSFVEGLEVERKIGSIKSGGIFKAFQSKKVKEVLCSNPAELSRSTSSTESS